MLKRLQINHRTFYWIQVVGSFRGTHRIFLPTLLNLNYLYAFLVDDNTHYNFNMNTKHQSSAETVKMKMGEMESAENVKHYPVKRKHTVRFLVILQCCFVFAALDNYINIFFRTH